jgi:signal transduction histidine kinase
MMMLALLLLLLLAGALAWHCLRLRAALARSQQDTEQLRSAAVAERARHDEWRRAYQLDCQRESRIESQRECQLESQLESQRFTAMLSHEFRSPLATIDGVIQSLEMTADDASEATRKRYRKMGRALDRLLALVDDYLSPQRMASIGRAPVVNHITVAALLEDALAQVDASRHRITLQMEGAGPTLLRCEPDAMRMCLQVLLENAVNYAPPGSLIELIARLAPEGGIEIVVQDDGIGVPVPDLPQVFDKFFRGSNAGAHAGSGLGLYIAKTMIEAQGGTLTVQNRCQGGAAFRIWLPAGIALGKSLASVASNSDNSAAQAAVGSEQSNA